MKRWLVMSGLGVLCLGWMTMPAGCSKPIASEEAGNESTVTETVTEKPTDSVSQETSTETVAEPTSESATEPAPEPVGDGSTTPEPSPEIAPDASVETTPETSPEPLPEPPTEATPETVNETAPDTAGPQTCDEVKTAYNKVVAQTTCASASDCHVITGYCGIGLGGCWHVTAKGASQKDLDALRDRWKALQCRGPVCSCVPPPSKVACVAGECKPDTGVTTCSEIRSQYNQQIQNNTSCSLDSDCQVLNGHCGVGLGGCYYAVNTSISQKDLNALRDQWTQQKCSGPVCRCTAPPSGAKCDAGVCKTTP